MQGRNDDAALRAFKRVAPKSLELAPFLPFHSSLPFPPSIPASSTLSASSSDRQQCPGPLTNPRCNHKRILQVADATTWRYPSGSLKGWERTNLVMMDPCLKHKQVRFLGMPALNHWMYTEALLRSCHNACRHGACTDSLEAARLANIGVAWSSLTVPESHCWHTKP